MQNLQKKAIVIGATGLVGQTLVHLLEEQSEFVEILVVIRKPTTAFRYCQKVTTLLLDDFLLLNDEDVHGYSHAFSCLGTTIKQAGSKQAFYETDFEVNAHFADLIQDKSIHYLLVSALGANPNSVIFYNRVKGELEQYVRTLGLSKLSIFRPSLLIGKRSEQRVFEDLGQTIFKMVEKKWTKPFKYKPVTAEQLARTMLLAAQNQTATYQLYDNLEIQKN